MIPRIASVVTATLVCVFASASVPTAAEAKNDDMKRQCIASAETAQNLRMSNKPLAARSALRECARDACPRVVRSKCAHWLEEAEAEIPTVVLNARDASGADITDVTVTIDGKPLGRALDGSPLPLEPGEHMFEVARNGTLVRSRVLLATGEKNRLVSMTFSDAQPGAISDSRETHEYAPHEETPAASHPSRAPAWIFAVVSAAAVGSFAYFGVTGQSELSDLKRTCGGHCDSDTAHATWNKLIVADVSLGVAVVTAGLATYFFLRKGPETGVPQTALRGLTVSPSLRGQGASVGWSAHF